MLSFYNDNCLIFWKYLIFTFYNDNLTFYDSYCLAFLEIFDFHIGINLYVTGILYFLFCFEFAVWTYLEGNEIVTF